MNKELDKKAIRERIEALRKRIQTQGVEPILEKRTNAESETSHEHSLGKESFFYILETKTLVLSIIACLAIIGSAYAISLKTNYLSVAANFIFRSFS